MLAIAFAHGCGQWAIRTDASSHIRQIVKRSISEVSCLASTSRISVPSRFVSDGDKHIQKRRDGGNPRDQQILSGRRALGRQVQGDLPAVLSRPAFDKPIRNQPVHQPDRSGMRQAEDPPQHVVGHALAIPNDDECGRRLAAAADDLARSLLDPIHDGERKRPQQIRDFGSVSMRMQ